MNKMINYEKLADDMIQCIRKQDIDGIRQCVEDGFNLNQELRNYQKKTPAEYALAINCNHSFKCLIELGANVHLKNSDTNLFYECCNHGVLDNLKTILDHGYKIYFQNTVHFDAFYRCCVNGAPEIAIYLLEKGFGEHSEKPEMINAFLVSWNNKELLAAFFKNGFDINLIDKDGDSLISIAARSSNIDAVDFLIDHGAEVNPHTSRNAPLISAVVKGNDEMAKHLIARGASVNAVSQEEFPLEVAVNFSDIRMSKLLLKSGADISMKSKDGENPFVAAVRRKYSVISDTLLPHVKDIDSVNKLGHSALMYACFNNFYDLAVELLDKGANVNIKSNKNETALTFSAKEGRVAIVSLILESRGHLMPTQDLKEALIDVKESQSTECAAILENFLLMREALKISSIGNIKENKSRVRL